MTNSPFVKTSGTLDELFQIRFFVNEKNAGKIRNVFKELYVIIENYKYEDFGILLKKLRLELL